MNVIILDPNLDAETYRDSILDLNVSNLICMNPNPNSNPNFTQIQK